MSISPEGHVPEPNQKTNKLPTWIIVTIVIVVVLLIIACCLAVIIIASVLFYLPAGNFYSALPGMLL